MDFENLFHFIKKYSEEACALFPVSNPLLDEFDSDLTHGYSLKVSDELTLEKFTDLFYLAKLFANFVDDDGDSDISLKALDKKFTEIAHLIPSKKTYGELIFDALNDYEMWSIEFYRGFASFEQLVRYYLITGRELKVWFGDYYIIFI